MHTTKTLAAEMGVTEGDLKGFIDCLSLWMAKGFSFEQAVEKHMAQMTRLAENADKLPKSIAVSAFFPA